LPNDLQQRDATDLIARLRDVLGSSGPLKQSETGLQVEDLPGLYCRVTLDGAILGVSPALAHELGAASPKGLRGRPVGAFLPELIAGSPLVEEIRERGEIRDVPVRLTRPGTSGSRRVLLSARVESGNRSPSYAWTGCLTVPAAAGALDESGLGAAAAVSRTSLDQTRREITAQLEGLCRQFPPCSTDSQWALLCSAMRLQTVALAQIEALAAVQTPAAPEPFDPRAAIAGLCQAAARLAAHAGVRVLFDAPPDLPARMTGCEWRMTACARLLLGAAAIADDVRAIVVQMDLEEGRRLVVEFCLWTSGGVLDERCLRQVELAGNLAATFGGKVSVEPALPECRKLVLRTGIEVRAQDGGGAVPEQVPALRALRALIVGPGADRGPVLARWLERQQADVTLASTVEEAQRIRGARRPDVAIFGLSGHAERPGLLADIPVLELRRAGTPAAAWPDLSIEDPVFEEDLLRPVSDLLARLSATPAEPRTPASGAARILAVEDNPVNQTVIEKMLRKLGYEVDLARSGVEALAALRRRTYDAVLMDWEMPGMDGLETTSNIRQFPEPLCRVPIIAVTAHAMAGDRETCLQAGMDDYVSKPVEFDVLRKMLEQWLAHPARRPRP